MLGVSLPWLQGPAAVARRGRQLYNSPMADDGLVAVLQLALDKANARIREDVQTIATLNTRLVEERQRGNQLQRQLDFERQEDRLRREQAARDRQRAAQKRAGESEMAKIAKRRE